MGVDAETTESIQLSHNTTRHQDLIAKVAATFADIQPNAVGKLVYTIDGSTELVDVLDDEDTAIMLQEAQRQPITLRVSTKSDAQMSDDAQRKEEEQYLSRQLEMLNGFFSVKVGGRAPVLLRIPIATTRAIQAMHNPHSKRWTLQLGS